MSAVNGVQVVGHASNSFGLGVASSRLKTLLWSAGLNLERVNAKSAAHTHQVIASNPDTLSMFYSPPTDMHFRIGFWSWELPDAPGYFKRSARLLDDVWTVSEFSNDALKRSGISSKVIRLPIPYRHTLKPRPGSRSRECFRVLVSFDFASDWRRKNPMAAIRAYLEAFPDECAAELVLKYQNSENHTVEMLALQDMTRHRKDVRHISSKLSSTDYSKLLSSSSVYLSLHRSEGYGLNLADSMAYGIPVIATGYSGNLDYMSVTNSLLVPYRLERAKFYAGLPTKSVWAEPDEMEASRFLREIYEDEELRVEIGQAGQLSVRQEHSLEKAVSHFRETVIKDEFI